MKIINAQCHDDLVLRFTPGKFHKATVEAPINYTWDDTIGHRALTVPVGTRYNGVGPGNSAFIWIFEKFVQRWGRGTVAALPHDIAFATRFMNIEDIEARRKYADCLFRALLLTTGPHVRRRDGVFSYVSSLLEVADWRIRVALMYYAVRWFGAGVWNAHDRDFGKV